MKSWRGRIAGIEVECRSRADLVDALVAPWAGYASHGGSPDITVEYNALDGFSAPTPTVRERRRRKEATLERGAAERPGAPPPQRTNLSRDRPYPAFACEAAPDGTLHLWRHDARGVLTPAGARFEGLPARHGVETALRLALSVALPRAGGLLVHSSGAILDGRGFLFTGESGAGKSTLAGLLAPRVLLGDDLTAILPGPTGWTAHATPFAGEKGPVPDASAPLAGICFLTQSAHHALTPLPRGAALPRLMKNVLAYVAEREGAARTLAAAAAAVAAVPCYALAFARDAGVARLLEHAAGST